MRDLFREVRVVENYGREAVRLGQLSSGCVASNGPISGQKEM